MGQASRFRLGEPVLRFHASDSEASSPSVVSSGFAQVLGDDFRFFPSEDEATPAASSVKTLHPSMPTCICDFTLCFTTRISSLQFHVESEIRAKSWLKK